MYYDLPDLRLVAAIADSKIGNDVGDMVFGDVIDRQEAVCIAACATGQHVDRIILRHVAEDVIAIAAIERVRTRAADQQIAAGAAHTGQHWTADCTVDGAIVLEEGEVVEQTIG